MIRVVLFVLLIVLSLHLPWWCLLPLLVGYMYYYVGYELIIVAACLDAYYTGDVIMIPYMTMYMICLIISFEFLRPRLRIFSQK